ncbi:transglutaminase-like cysteine peptidase [Glaciecola sp. MH2013]|uniref:transglutaminase-like cysteine peptidase n=1 Tax=Glaciecola sp. MH2013 TaxID=2785524 RepID=UPI00189EF8B1|nr:transglutaminase-like cysteine peptidase [Glaciecola sp. MH2013]MBF7074878.1 transglutaminase-like cysteine peptidase [Glaciecola sp. MH2013]
MRASIWLGSSLFLLLLPYLAWSNLAFDKIDKQGIVDTYGAKALQRIERWQSLLSDLNNEAEDEKLQSVNDFFNKLDFVDDKTLWGKEDYWATPIEFLSSNAGDCEDFTIAKYFTLVELGVDKSKLRLMYVTATKPPQAHMVLAYYESKDAIPLVLDNLNKRILPANRRSDLIPIYSFNGDGLWLAKAQGRGRQMQGKGNNSLWLDLNERMKSGF